MKRKISKVLVIICMMLMLLVGCSTKNNDGKNLTSESSQYSEQANQNGFNTVQIENDMAYFDSKSGEGDDSVVSERYKKVKKEDLTYNSLDKIVEQDGEKSSIVLQRADSIKDDIDYKVILLGFTYPAEESLINLTYDEAIELVQKVLPDDIEKVNSVLDKEVNKEYIYYKSEKGNFRVGLCYGGEFFSDNLNEIHKNAIVGIDYSKEIK